MFVKRCALAMVAVATTTITSQATVIISEIMYNPNSSESAPGYAEWVEIYNTGVAAVDISGWTLRDEDGTSTTTIPAATTIAAGEAVVLFDSDTTLSEFQAAWGSGYQAFALDLNSLSGLSNSPSSTSEILELIDAAAASVDIANYDDSSPWPSDSPDGPSIYVLPNALSAIANDDGANWAASSVGVDGAFNNVMVGNFNGVDTGSPGFVAVPEPGAAMLLLFGLAILRRRCRG